MNRLARTSLFFRKSDLDIFNEVMGANISTENADTIGGFIYGEIGDVPIGGEVLKADGITLTVDEVVGRRISKVRVKGNRNHENTEDGKHAE